MSNKASKARSIDIVRASENALKLYIQVEGKRLNQQIAQLEKFNIESASFAYKNLIDKPQYNKFLTKSKSGHTKVDITTRGKSRQQLQEIASVIKKTVTAQTITKSGITAYYGKVFASLRSRYPGLNKFSDEQLADILTTMGFESSKGFEGSDRIFQKIASAKDAESIVKYLEKTNGFETIKQADKEYKDLMGTKFEYVSTDENPFK